MKIATSGNMRLIDELDVRVILAFDEFEMLIITVMYVGDL